MRTVTITISIDIPDGTAVSVGNGAVSGTVPRPPQAPQSHAAPSDEPPWPDMTSVALEAFPDALIANPSLVLHDTPHVVASAPSAWRCPDHGTPAKVVPGGVSKRTGKAFNSFEVCSTQGCDRKPGR